MDPKMTEIQNKSNIAETRQKDKQKYITQKTKTEQH